MRKQNIKILIARHGTKLKDGSLDEKAISGLYNQGKDALYSFIRDDNINPDQAAVWYTDVKRTHDTANAFIAGAYGLKEPDKLTALRRVPSKLEGLAQIEVPYLAGKHIALNEEALERDGQGLYLKNWMENREARTYDNQPITSWDLMERGYGQELMGIVSDCIRDNRNVGVVVAHGGVVEAMTSCLINSSKHMNMAHLYPQDKPVTYEEMGREFNQGDYAVLTINPAPLGKKMTATLKRGDKEFPVDLKLMQNHIGPYVKRAWE